jgi:hypothetical protein
MGLSYFLLPGILGSPGLFPPAGVKPNQDEILNVVQDDQKLMAALDVIP